VALDRMRDRLPVNDPYEGLVAAAYDSWLPVDEAWPDEIVYRRALADVEGPILELGCGTGRPLLRWLAEGLDVEGLDASEDMLAVLRRHAMARGLEPVLHHGDFAPLSIGGQFGAIVCLAGTFALVDDAKLAERSLVSFYEHLAPGGLLAMTLGSPTHDPATWLTWRLRRTGTDADGTTYVVHECNVGPADDQVEVVYNRHEIYDATGRQVDAFVRKHRLRWWTQDQFGVLLRRAGFGDVQAVGDESGWVSLSRKP
jgi:SAM-dependent methyltransferase